MQLRDRTVGDNMKMGFSKRTGGMTHTNKMQLRKQPVRATQSKKSSSKSKPKPEVKIFKWDNRAVNRLIQLMQEVKRCGIQRPIWSTISAQLKAEGLNFPPKTCTRKWHGLLTMFRKVMELDEDMRVWPHYADMLEFQDGVNAVSLEGRGRQTEIISDEDMDIDIKYGVFVGEKGHTEEQETDTSGTTPLDSAVLVLLEDGQIITEMNYEFNSDAFNNEDDGGEREVNISTGQQIIVGVADAVRRLPISCMNNEFGSTSVVEAKASAVHEKAGRQEVTDSDEICRVEGNQQVMFDDRLQETGDPAVRVPNNSDRNTIFKSMIEKTDKDRASSDIVVQGLFSITTRLLALAETKLELEKEHQNIMKEWLRSQSNSN